MSKCGPDHIGNRTCKSERSVGAKDPCNDADRAAGVVILGDTPEGFAKFVSGETEKWAKVIRFDGIKPE